MTGVQTCALPISEIGEQFRVCESYRALGNIYRSKGNIEKAIYHLEVAIGIASAFNWHDALFWIHYELAVLYRGEGRFDDAHAHIGRAKSHTADSAYLLGRAMEEQARIWYDQHKLEEARSAALHAVDVYGKIGAVKDVEECRSLLRKIDNNSVASGQPAFDCELVKISLCPARTDSSL